MLTIIITHTYTDADILPMKTMVVSVFTHADFQRHLKNPDTTYWLQNYDVFLRILGYVKANHTRLE